MILQFIFSKFFVMVNKLFPLIATTSRWILLFQRRGHNMYKRVSKGVSDGLNFNAQLFLVLSLIEKIWPKLWAFEFRSRVLRKLSVWLSLSGAHHATTQISVVRKESSFFSKNGLVYKNVYRKQSCRLHRGPHDSVLIKRPKGYRILRSSIAEKIELEPG